MKLDANLFSGLFFFNPIMFSKMEQNNLSTFVYNGNPITFNFSDGSKMVNATEVAKAFPKKSIGSFLRNNSTKELIKLLEERYANSHIGSQIAGNQRYKKNDVVDNQRVIRVIKGGMKTQGTWMCEELILYFAAWLSPELRLWVYDRIKELLTNGNVSLSPENNLLEADEFTKYVRTQFNERNALLNKHNEQLKRLKARQSVEFSDLVGKQMIELRRNTRFFEANVSLRLTNEMYSVSEYAKSLGIYVKEDTAAAIGKKAVKMCNFKKWDYRSTPHDKYGTVNIYPLAALRIVFEEWMNRAQGLIN